ncbi:MAG: precorrin-8X methylmutase [Corynebacterium sp.]|nr:precorrin-8X methylmutase [Corynebacterium sp.]
MKPYIANGPEIYRESFAIIREEADLGRFSPGEEIVAVRMIHACGQVDLADDIEFSEHFDKVSRRALNAGAPILCDANMVAAGVTRSRLPKDNQVLCMIRDPEVALLAQEIGNTRSAAAVELWRPHLEGAVVAIGNAPTALFYLLEKLATDPDFPRPAAILGMPVGFVGAAESKALLSNMATDIGVEFATVHGRRGGSAITCGALNALAAPYEIAPN